MAEAPGDAAAVTGAEDGTAPGAAAVPLSIALEIDPPTTLIGPSTVVVVVVVVTVTT
jgi:hypothetical protein